VKLGFIPYGRTVTEDVWNKVLRRIFGFKIEEATERRKNT
jgi:hypothetical protein